MVRRTVGRNVVLGALVLALGVGGVAAAAAGSGGGDRVERPVPVVRIDPAEIRSGDEEVLRMAPRPVSPEVTLDAGRNVVGDRSPWAGRWGPEIEALAAYEPQATCLPGARPAVAAFARLLEKAYPQGRDLGTTRACDQGARSEHKEGRAHDWGLRVSTPAERMAAEELLAWLLATDEHGNDFAMARRLGIMYVIWDGHVWSSSAADDGWRVYRGPSAHTDHVHLSFSWDGATGATSFWDGVRIGPWLFAEIEVGSFPTTLHLGRDRYRSELGPEPGSVQEWGTPAPEPAEDPAADGAGELPAASTQPAPTPAPAPAPAPAPPIPDAGEVLPGPVTPAPLPPILPAPTIPTTTLVPLPPPPVVDDVVDAVTSTAGDLLG